MRSVFNASIRRFTSSAVRSCFAARSGSFRSTMPSARNARSPISFTALAAASMWKYMSLKVVVPVLTISRQASLVPQYTSSGVSLASAGHLRLQPRRQLEVVAPASEEGHRGVRVQVHETRERDLPFPVDHRVRFALLTDLGDPISFDVYLGDVAFDLHVPDEDAHRIRSNAFPTTVRVRSAFCRCVSRIFSNVSGSSTIPLQKLSTVHREA